MEPVTNDTPPTEEGFNESKENRHSSSNPFGKELNGISAETLLTAERAGIFEVRLRQSQILRLAGNDAFKEGKFGDAIKFYERALYHADFEGATLSFEYTQEHRLQIFSTVYPVYLNLARCAVQDSRFRDAISSCNKCFGIVDNEYIPPSAMAKIHFLKSKALMKLGEFETAESEIQDSLKYCPDDSALLSMLKECRTKKIQDMRSSKESWKGAFKSTKGLYREKADISIVEEESKNFFQQYSFVMIGVGVMIISMIYLVTVAK